MNIGEAMNQGLFVVYTKKEVSTGRFVPEGYEKDGVLVVVAVPEKISRKNGALVACMEDGKIRIGWSLCNHKDTFIRKRGLWFAQERMRALWDAEEMGVPLSVSECVRTVVKDSGGKGHAPTSVVASVDIDLGTILPDSMRTPLYMFVYLCARHWGVQITGDNFAPWVIKFMRDSLA